MNNNTLGLYKILAAECFGEETPAVEFLDKRIKETGKDTIVDFDEAQMMFLLMCINEERETMYNKNRFIALDLELEQPNDGGEVTDSLLAEEAIIQVGWVVFEREPFKLLETRSRFVDIGCRLSTFIKKLTRISDEDIENGTTVDRIYRELSNDQQNYGTSRVIRQWGGGDLMCLARELSPDIPWNFGHSGFNVKHMWQDFADMTGENRSGGLSKSLSRIGLNWEGHGKHQADIDAHNTARLYSEIYRKLKYGFNLPDDEKRYQE